MKQPLMVVPPAQAEILYDAALEEEMRGIRPRRSPSVNDDWDDRESHETSDPRASQRKSAPIRHTRQ